MIGFHAVTASGTKRFSTPFAAMNHINKLKTEGTVEAEAADGTRTTVWRRNVDGSWDETLEGES